MVAGRCLPFVDTLAWHFHLEGQLCKAGNSGLEGRRGERVGGEGGKRIGLGRRSKGAWRADELTAELLAAGLPAGEEVDALEAFIGSGDSGDPSWAGRDTRELRAEATARRATG